MKIAGSVVLVTGANRGLGAEYVRQLLDRGASKVYAAARNPESITTPGVVPIKLDVTNASDIAAAVQACGDITMLINNAGVVIGGRIMANFAQMQNDIVIDVIVVANSDCDGLPFPASEPVGQAFIKACGIKGVFLQTSYNNNFRGTYAGIGYTWNGTDFVAPVVVPD